MTVLHVLLTTLAGAIWKLHQHLKISWLLENLVVNGNTANYVLRRSKKILSRVLYWKTKLTMENCLLLPRGERSLILAFLHVNVRLYECLSAVFFKINVISQLPMHWKYTIRMIKINCHNIYQIEPLVHNYYLIISFCLNIFRTTQNHEPDKKWGYQFLDYLSLKQNTAIYFCYYSSGDLDNEYINMATPQSGMHMKTKNTSKKKIISAFQICPRQFLKTSTGKVI